MYRKIINFIKFIIEKNSFKNISTFTWLGSSKSLLLDTTNKRSCSPVNDLKFVKKPLKLKYFIQTYKYRKTKKQFKKDILENLNFKLFLKLLYTTIFENLSLNGYIKLKTFYIDFMAKIYSHEYAKFIFNLLNFIDTVLWRLWFVFSNYDLKTEHLKQSFFLHMYTGNLIFMFQYGLLRCYV